MAGTCGKGECMKTRIVKVGKSFTLYPLSDVHWPLHDHDRLKEWRRVVLADDLALVTLGGDLFDFARGKYRAHLESYTADNTSRSAVDEMAYAKVDGLVEFLKPVAEQKKIVATCVGNHFWGFSNGRVSDQELALLLGIGHTFVGPFGLIRVDVGKRGCVKSAHHDAGRKGGTASADMLAFQHWSHGVAADIYVAGHTHRQYAGIYQTKVTIDDEIDKVGDKKLVFIRSGAFMKSYTDSVPNPEAPYHPDYAEVAMLPPTVLGIISVSAEFDAKGRLHYELRQRTL